MGMGNCYRNAFIFVVFRLRDPKSGPNIASAATVSLLEMGQFGNSLFATIFMSSFVFSRPIALIDLVS